MKAKVSRLNTGSYFAVFSQVGHQPIGFNIDCHSNNSWTITNHKGNEINHWITKSSMINWLESKSWDQLIELWSK